MNALINKGMPVVLALMTVGLFGIGMTAVRLPAESSPARRAMPARPAAVEPRNARPADTDKEMTVSGRVLSPEGKPVAGAELLLVGGKKGVEKLGVSDEQGCFTLSIPRGDRWASLLARAAGAGPDLIYVSNLKKGEKVELRLVKDHAIRGRLIDTEGKPVAGASVAVTSLYAYKDESLDSFIAMWKKRHPMSGVPGGVKGFWDRGVLPATTTDKDGRFTVTGAGIERLANLHVRGQGIAEAEYWVVNRPGFDPGPLNKISRDNAATMAFGLHEPTILWGPELSIVAEAEKPIRGIVKDRDTGKPRPGVKVRLSRNGGDLVPLLLEATTDAQGRYEIHGGRKSPKGYMVEVHADSANGYMACQARSPDTPGYGSITIDVVVRKGVVVTGRVIDKATGKSLPGFVMVTVLLDNPYATEYPEFDSSASFYSTPTGADGTFRIVTIPGPVILMGGPDTSKIADGDNGRYYYKPPMPDPKYPKYFPKNPDFGGAVFTLKGAITPLQGNFAKVLEIKPGVDVVNEDIVLEPASALPVRIVDGDNRPVKGTWVAGVSPQNWHRPVQIAKDSCKVYHLESGKPRLFVVYDPAGKQYGTLRLKGDEKDPALVKLVPAGTVKGRLVDENGKAVAGAGVRFYHKERTAEEIHNLVYEARLIETAADGTFMIEAVPGASFSMQFARGTRTFKPVKKIDASVTSGKTLDLGDVQINLDAPGEE